MHLYEAIAHNVDAWRAEGYAHEDYPIIAEILEWAADPDGAGFRLRPPQVRALETYWYLRLMEDTARIPDLYLKLFPSKKNLLAAMGIPNAAWEASDYELDSLWQSIETDNDFVKTHKLEALRETLTLDYPSYILALAMGAGKTILIGAIFATEFAMAMEYPEGPFVQNALVFAPGKTIIESLRQLAETRFDRILPPRLYKSFAASVKLTFTRDGEKDIPVIRGSSYNVVVTNTEKIRIQQNKIPKGYIGSLLTGEAEDEAKAAVANLRLQAIASLPHLAVFSDEAHHTYGQSLDTELKKVRQTVDYLADNTNVVCVVNTTGTPYFKRQLLRDVVAWYGLSQGIGDGILKEIAGNIQSFDFHGDVATYVGYVVKDFFTDYGDVTLPDGTPAKLAMYFPQTDDVRELRAAIETALTEMGLTPTLILEHHTGHEAKEDFDRFKFKDSPHRIALLVDRGVEGWDAPALFACALVRQLENSNNFVLQAASRCLRQVPGNTHKARIYLSQDNVGILDRQLQETYGETIADLNQAESRSATATITLRKLDIPPLVVRQIVRTVVRREDISIEPLRLDAPEMTDEAGLTKRVYDTVEQTAGQPVLVQTGETVMALEGRTVGLYSAAATLSATYRADLWAVYDELRRLYPSGELTEAHLRELAKQIEAHTRNYEVKEETIEKALALVKPEGFEKKEENGIEVYTATIRYPVDKEPLLSHLEKTKDAQAHGFGFHYSPYNFDSGPEQDFFLQLLRHMNQHPADVEDIYFTGALTTPDKTDFAVEYLGEDDRWHRYTPDLIIRCKDGRCLIVEIKSTQFEAGTKEDLARLERGEAAVTPEGRKAVALRRWETLNPDRLRYQLVFAAESPVPYLDIKKAQEFVEECTDDER